MILEAKEVVKYFYKNGLPSEHTNTLEVRNKKIVEDGRMDLR